MFIVLPVCVIYHFSQEQRGPKPERQAPGTSSCKVSSACTMVHAVCNCLVEGEAKEIAKEIVKWKFFADRRSRSRGRAPAAHVPR